MYYAELNFPPIPKELLVDPHESTEKQESSEIVSRRMGLEESYFRNGEKINPCSYWVTSVRNKDLVSWLRKNIPGTGHLNRFCYQNAYHSTGGYHLVHSDISRNYALNYMIKTGNNAQTFWWKEKEQPEIRDSKIGGGYNASSISTYNNLEILDSTTFKEHRWYLMSTCVLHDVGTIVGMRKSITINIPKNMERKILEILNVL